SAILEQDVNYIQYFHLKHFYSFSFIVATCLVKILPLSFNMGNFVSIEISGDQILDRIIRCLRGKGYIRNLNKNLESLRKDMEDLRASQDVVQKKVVREEETRHQQRREDVQPPPRSEVEERPTQPTIGQEEMLEKAWNRLMEDGVGIMGLHGMGGVGKTTLFKKIHNKFTELAGTFDVVIWIVVSQGAK
ncbi:unnamed protein product, partial [Arabidopsis halleri]